MKLLSLTIIVLVSLSASAQKFKGGIHGGLASCQVDGDNLTGYNKPGFILGGFVTLNKNDKLSFQIELEYIQKGSRFVPKANQLGYNVPVAGVVGSSYYLKLGYVEMPFMIRYTNNKFLYETGLSFGTLLHSYVGTEFGEMPISAANPEFEPFEYSLNLGISRIISDHLLACFRYNYSILPIRIPPGSVGIRTGQYNNNMQFAIRYIFK